MRLSKGQSRGRPGGAKGQRPRGASRGPGGSRGCLKRNIELLNGFSSEVIWPKIQLTPSWPLATVQ